MTNIHLTLINLVLCSAWGWGAFMRLRASHCGVLCRVRIVYTGMFVAASASGFKLQLFGEYAGWSDLIVSMSMVCFMLLNSKRWKHGAPRDVLKPSSQGF